MFKINTKLHGKNTLKCFQMIEIYMYAELCLLYRLVKIKIVKLQMTNLLYKNSGKNFIHILGLALRN